MPHSARPEPKSPPVGPAAGPGFAPAEAPQEARAASSAAVRALGRFVSSFGFACLLLLWLMLLTLLGTFAQRSMGLYEAQKKYFDSVVAVHEIFGVPVPLPGVYLLLGMLGVNLAAGGIMRLCKGWALKDFSLLAGLIGLNAALIAAHEHYKLSMTTAVASLSVLNLAFAVAMLSTRRAWSRGGILITHLGMGFMLLAGFLSFHFKDDGHQTLYEGERSGEFQSYHDWEIAAYEAVDHGLVEEQIIPQSDFPPPGAAAPRHFRSDRLPFDLVVERCFKSCEPVQKGPMFSVDVPVVEGLFLKELEPHPEAEVNIAGAYVTRIDRHTGERESTILFGFARHDPRFRWRRVPWTFEAGGKRYAVELRRKRWELPFSIELDKFTHELHPGTRIDKTFRSDVTLREGGASRPIEISMNRPLRHRGYTFFQASYGPRDALPGTPLFSTFAVVRNPSDHHPLYACIIIASGLLVHFVSRLFRFIAAENKRRGGEA